MGYIRINSRKLGDFDPNYRAYGANIYLSIPRANEKLSFKFGIENMSIFSEDEIQIKKFPIQIQYVYSPHKFKPKLSIGYSFWSKLYNQEIEDYFHTLCLNVGFIYKSTEPLGVSVDFGSEFIPLNLALSGHNYNESIDIGMLVYSLKFGLYYDF